MLGTCYLNHNMLSEAVQAFSHVLSFLRSIEALNNLGIAYMRNGDYVLAVQNLLEAHNLAGSNATVALNLAILRHLQGNESSAQTILSQSIEEHPQDGMLQFLLGLVLKAQGKSDQAKSALSKAMRFGVNVQKLQREDPKSWARILSTFSP